MGEPLLLVKGWMGHASAETLLRYAHVQPDPLQDRLPLLGEPRRYRTPCRLASAKANSFSDWLDGPEGCFYTGETVVKGLPR